MALAHGILEAARAAGAETVHLAAGALPLLRPPGGRLAPVPGYDTPLSPAEAAGALAVLVPPERWPAIEAAGSGEAVAQLPSGAAVRLSLFRAADGWRIVASFRHAALQPQP